MDIILFQPYLDGMGGAERVVLEISKRFNPIIYTVNYAPSKTYRGFREFEIRFIKPHASSGLANLIAGLDRDRRMKLVASAGLNMLSMKLNEDYDVISSHLPPSEWIRNRNERVSWYCHGPNAAFELYDIMFMERTLPEKILLKSAAMSYRAIELHVIRKLETICTCSEFTKLKIQKALGRTDAQIIYPAVESKDFGCEDYSNYFFYASRIVPEKQIHLSIEAFKGFNTNGKWKLVIAGNLYDVQRNRDYYEHLKQISKGFNISFELDASDARIKELYSNCYATLFSSLDEDWGIVILEAMASSKPVISINKGGPTISIVNGKTGFLVNSVDEMAEKMKFLADNPDICEQMGKAGRKRVEQNYTWKIFLDKMDKVFKETAKM